MGQAAEATSKSIKAAWEVSQKVEGDQNTNSDASFMYVGFVVTVDPL